MVNQPLLTLDQARKSYPAGGSTKEEWQLALTCIQVLRPDDWAVWLGRRTELIEGDQNLSQHWWSPFWVLVKDDRPMSVSEVTKRARGMATSTSPLSVLNLAEHGVLEYVDDQTDKLIPPEVYEKSIVRLGHKIPKVPDLNF